MVAAGARDQEGQNQHRGAAQPLTPRHHQPGLRGLDTRRAEVGERAHRQARGPHQVHLSAAARRRVLPGPGHQLGADADERPE